MRQRMASATPPASLGWTKGLLVGARLRVHLGLRFSGFGFLSFRAYLRAQGTYE